MPKRTKNSLRIMSPPKTTWIPLKSSLICYQTLQDQMLLRCEHPSVLLIAQIVTEFQSQLNLSVFKPQFPNSISIENFNLCWNSPHFFQRQIKYWFQPTQSCSKEKHWKYFEQLQMALRTCVQIFLDHSRKYINSRPLEKGTSKNFCHLSLESPGVCLVAACLTSAQGRVGIFNLHAAGKL